MKTWLRRVLALALISLGIALVFLPYNDKRSGSIESEVVYLQKEDLLNADSIKSQYPGVEIMAISGSELTEENYPNIWWAANYLDQKWAKDTCNISEWNKFQNTLFEEKKGFRLIVFRDALLACSTIEVKQTSKVQFSYLGRYNTQIKELSENDLKKYKTIIKAIDNVNFGKESVAELTPIPIKEWYKMVDRYLNPMEDSQTFKFNGIYYGPEFGWDYIEIKGSLTNLSSILKIIGIVFLVLGISIMVKLYFKISKKGIIFLLDFINLSSI